MNTNKRKRSVVRPPNPNDEQMTRCSSLKLIRVYSCSFVAKIPSEIKKLNFAAIWNARGNVLIFGRLESKPARIANYQQVVGERRVAVPAVSDIGHAAAAVALDGYRHAD
jgi:hypothetical protein